MATIKKRSETSYLITVSCGYMNGKQIRRNKTVRVSESMTERQKQRAVEKEAVLFEQEVQNGTFLDGEKITFEEFAQKWLTEYAEKELAPKTVSRYKSLLARINQGIGGIKLSKLQPTHIISFMNNLAEEGIREDDRYIMADKYIAYFKENKAELSSLTINARTISSILSGKPTSKKIACKIADEKKINLSALFKTQNTFTKLSSQTIMHHYRLLNTILNTAVQWNLLLNNPVERTKPPRVEQKEIQSLDDAQVANMLRLLESAPVKYQSAVYTAVFGGLRIGEVSALKWTDIDFDTGRISITKSRQYLTGLGIFEKSPKNESSKRELKLPAIALQKLNEWKKEQILERLSIGSRWIDSNSVFTQWNGSPMSPDTISHWFTKWISKTDLPPITFHGLRHSNASLLIAHGTDISTVSKRLGHSRISTTTDIYTHPIKKMDEEAANTLDNIFTPMTKIASK